MISPNVVDVWEATVTLALFAILIMAAYLADIKVWKRKKADLELELADQKSLEVEDIDAILRRFAKEMAVESDAVPAFSIVSFNSVREAHCSNQSKKVVTVIINVKLIRYVSIKNCL